MNDAKVVDIQILNVEEHISNIIINYAQTYSDGGRKVCRRNVKFLDGYCAWLMPKPIVSAECIGKVYCGVLRNDARLLFIVKLSDGSVQLIQSKEGTSDCLKLFEFA